MARPTVQDVARTAGVSVGTVSRVLNGSSAVSAAAKEKVNAAITELSYRPLASARDLRRDRTMRVLALAKNLDSLVISEVFRGVGDAAADSGTSASSQRPTGTWIANSSSWTCCAMAPWMDW